jgi:hypothetical protein
LRDNEPQIKAKGAKIAAIGLGGMNFAQRFREEFKIDFPLLVDEDSSAHRVANLGKANIFHLFRSDNKGARKRASLEGFKQAGIGKDPFQLGGTFVFAPGDRDVYVHISKTFGDNAAMSELIAAIPSK